VPATCPALKLDIHHRRRDAPPSFPPSILNPYLTQHLSRRRRVMSRRPLAVQLYTEARTFCSTLGTSAMRWPGRITRMAASSPVAAAWMTSAARPVTGASGSAWTNCVTAAVVMKPSMCVPRSLNPRPHLQTLVARSSVPHTMWTHMGALPLLWGDIDREWKVCLEGRGEKNAGTMNSARGHAAVPHLVPLTAQPRICHRPFTAV
jgi:hypothetical protein